LVYITSFKIEKVFIKMSQARLMLNFADTAIKLLTIRLDDRDAALAAVLKDGNALQYASAKLRADKMLLVQINPCSLLGIPKPQRFDADLVLTAINQSPNIVYHIEPAFSNPVVIRGICGMRHNFKCYTKQDCIERCAHILGWTLPSAVIDALLVSVITIN